MKKFIEWIKSEWELEKMPIIMALMIPITWIIIYNIT